MKQAIALGFTDEESSHGLRHIKRILSWFIPCYVVAVWITDLTTRDLVPNMQVVALYGTLAFLLGARYLFWQPVASATTPTYVHLFWLSFGALLVLAMNLLVAGLSVLYALLVASEGYMALTWSERFAGRIWFGLVLATSVFAHLVDNGWVVGGLHLLPFVPIGIGAVAAMELLLVLRSPELSKPSPQLRVENYEEYMNRIEALAIARERARIAREFHDTLGHTLTALDVQIELIARLPQERREEIQNAAQQARILVKEGLVDVRRSIQALQPAALESFSIVQAIQGLISDFERTANITVTWRVEGKTGPLPPELALPLYRAAQEALTNVRRHTKATTVMLNLRFNPNSVVFIAKNDGVESYDVAFGFGLRGLHERTRELHGEFYAGLERSGHFCIQVELPR
jgi:signal transduction histidine kinase